MTQFLFDSNCFITAYRFYYPYEIFNSLWNKILDKFHSGSFYITEEVYQEINQRADKIFKYLKQIPKNRIISPKSNPQCISNYSVITNYVYQSYSDKAKINDFLKTDAWLIAYALTFDEVVIVTYEKWRNSKSIPVIPLVCENFNLYVSPALRQHYDFYLTLKNKVSLSSYRCITFTEALFLNGIII